MNETTETTVVDWESGLLNEIEGWADDLIASKQAT